MAATAGLRRVYVCQPHASGRGGGLAILYNEKYKVSPLPVSDHQSFESSAIQISGSVPTILATIYRPPKPNPNFLNEFSDFISTLCSPPLKTRTVTFTRSAPWYTHQLKVIGRRLERLSRKTGLSVHKDMYNEHHLKYKLAMSNAKTVYYTSLIQTAEGNTQTLFFTLNHIIQSSCIGPSHMYSTANCNRFMNFFTSKIENIHKQLSSPCSSVDCKFCLSSITPPLSSLSSFQSPTINGIMSIIQKSKSSTCKLDPLPTTLVKLCLLSLSPLITEIIHSSLTSGSVPSPLKTAIITPILKKPGADPNNLNNFRPISNLPYLSKILEKIVASQIHNHLTNNNLYEQFQSGFHPLHSTETALVKITNDLLIAADSGLLTILILLDLTAAFDTISHHILLNRLLSIGINNTALSWFSSYLSDHTQFVQLKNFHSDTSPVKCGMPQGPWAIFSRNLVSTSTAMRMTPSSTTPLNRPLHSLPHPSLTVFKKLKYGFPTTFYNLTTIKQNFSLLALSPLSQRPTVSL